MPKTSGYVTVKEYADLLGISVQAVYKQIRAGRLEVSEITEAGRKVKYIKADAAPGAPEADASSERPNPGPAQPAGDPVRVALDLLGAQLQEKDKQIERLQADIKEKDAHIREQAAQLAELLRNSQQLQAHTVHLLEQHEAAQPDPVIEAQAEEEVPDIEEEQQKKKRGFWAWLLGG